MTSRRIALLASAVFMLWFAGCAQMSQVASGEVVVSGRMVVSLDKPWNQFEQVMGDGIPTWTQDGVTVDTLKFYVGLKNGGLIAETPSEPKGQAPLAFRSTMQTAEIVTLFERLYSRGGSSFTLEKVVPQRFVDTPGFRFEFSSIRKSDDVRLRGVGWGAVRNGELFAITYTAPRLSFYPSGLPSATAIANSARVRK
jgi:hypothetical protein